MKNLHQGSFYRHCVFVLIAVPLIMLSACTPQPKGPSVDDGAITFLDTLKNNDIEAALGFYSEKFYQGMPKEQWRDRLVELTKVNGPILRYSLRNKQADTRFSGKFYIYIYDTIHLLNGKEKRVNHVLTFIRPVEDVTKVELVGHKITVK